MRVLRAGLHLYRGLDPPSAIAPFDIVARRPAKSSETCGNIKEITALAGILSLDLLDSGCAWGNLLAGSSHERRPEDTYLGTHPKLAVPIALIPQNPAPPSLVLAPEILLAFASSAAGTQKDPERSAAEASDERGSTRARDTYISALRRYEDG